MNGDTPRKSVPKEGSNRGHEVSESVRATIAGSISGRPSNSHSAHTDDELPDAGKSADDEDDAGEAANVERGG